MEQRFPEFWITWLTPLLAGEENCEFKAWLKSRYWKPQKFTRADLKELYPENAKYEDKEQSWDQEHTALLNALVDEYRPKSAKVLKEVGWKIKGQTAAIAGKIDLVVFEPNLIIDAKTGAHKASHIAQIRAYLLAAERLYPGLEFKGLLRYPEGAQIEVTVDPNFKQRLYSLVQRLAGDSAEASPRYNECRFCEIAKCESRTYEEPVFETAEF